MSNNMTPLSKVAIFIRNGASIKQEDGAGGDPITRIETIAAREVNLNKCGYADVSSDDYDNYILDTGDILISHINSTKHLGKCAIFKGKKENVIHGMNLLCLRPNKEIADPSYVYFMLSSPLFLKQLPKITKNSVNQSSFNVKSFNGLEIPLPPLETQKQIAAVLEKADQLRKDCQQMEQELNSLAQSVFIDMFGDPLVNEKAWGVNSLEELTTKITDGKHGDCVDELGSGYFFVSAKNIRNGKIDYDGARQINKKEFDEVHRRTDLKQGDLVMINTGATIGRLAIADDDIRAQKATFQKSVAVIKPDIHKVNPVFLKYVFMTRIKDFAGAGSGSAIKNLLLSQMRAFKIITPPLELQRKFSDIERKIKDNTECINNEYREAECNFGSLMQKAFKGELNLKPSKKKRHKTSL